MTANRERIQRVHKALFPGYGPTPLRPLPALAAELGCAMVFVKDESRRYGLPAFKILGASWAICSLLGERWNVEPCEVDALQAKAEGDAVMLFTATDGNHGRAVARTASLLGLQASIFVPSMVEGWSRRAIESEGATVTIVQGDYDAAVRAAADASTAANGLLIQDMSWEGYEDAPARITEGYMTIAAEITAQMRSLPTVVVVPVGVGSLAQAMADSLGPSSSTGARIVTAEPDAAPCLHTSLAAGKPLTVHTRYTIMPGLNCGSVSLQAWPVLKACIQPGDAVVVTDDEVRKATKHLEAMRVAAGPCGAASLAAVRKVALSAEDVVVLICTEGPPERQCEEEADTLSAGVLKEGGVLKQTPLSAAPKEAISSRLPERGGASANTPFGKMLWG